MKIRFLIIALFTLSVNIAHADNLTPDGIALRAEFHQIADMWVLYKASEYPGLHSQIRTCADSVLNLVNSQSWSDNAIKWGVNVNTVGLIGPQVRAQLDKLCFKGTES